MPARFAEVGDRHAAIDEVAHSLEPLLEMYERDFAEGRGDMPYPPDYPKMPGEPTRVQPSRARKHVPAKEHVGALGDHGGDAERSS
jgi:hypothetical protein